MLPPADFCVITQGIVMKFVDFNILITFDLSYAESSDYRLVNKYLTEKGFEKLSSKGQKLPSNTYLGTESVIVKASESVLDAAKDLKNSVYSNLKRNMTNSGMTSVVFVLVSPSESTTYSCSKPSNY
jgi:hypothetical protein